MHLADISHVLGEWAKTKPLILRAWVFGSRARGNHRQDSDLDIAVELDPSAFPCGDESDGLATWMFEATEWSSELQALFPYSVQLEQYMGDKTPTIQAGLAHSSHLAYAKDGQDVC